MYIRSFIFIWSLFICLEGVLSTPGEEEDGEQELSLSTNIAEPEGESPSVDLEFFCCSPETENNVESPYNKIVSPDYGETLLAFLNCDTKEYFAREIFLREDTFGDIREFLSEISEKSGVYYFSMTGQIPSFFPQVFSSLLDIYIQGLSLTFFDLALGDFDSFKVMLPPERLLELKLQFSFEFLNPRNFLDIVIPLTNLHTLDLSFCSLSNPFLQGLRCLEFKHLKKLLLQGNIAIGTRYLPVKDPYKEEEEQQLDLRLPEASPNPYPLVHILCAPWFESLQELNLESCGLWDMHINVLRSSLKESQLQFLFLEHNPRIKHNAGLVAREIWTSVFPKIQEIKI